MHREIESRDHPGGVILDEDDCGHIDDRVNDRASAFFDASFVDRAVANDVAGYSPDSNGLIADIAMLVGALRAPVGVANPLLSAEDRIDRFMHEWGKLVEPLAYERAEAERDRIQAAYIKENLS